MSLIKFIIVITVIVCESYALGFNKEFERANVKFYYGKNTSTFTQYQPSNLTQLLTHPRFYQQPTVLYISGWMQAPSGELTKALLNAYCKRADHNVLVLDWGAYSNTPLITAVLQISKIARLFGRSFLKLFQKGLNDQSFHCVGHSFGAHGCGIFGRELVESSSGLIKLGRITGLDCAKIGFYPISVYEPPLNTKDAHFVDTIYSDNFFVGATEPIGHARFIVNNGQLQPGCPQYRKIRSLYDFMNVWCSHNLAVTFYAETVNPKNTYAYPGYRCDNNRLYQLGQCYSNPVNFMGFAARADIPGRFDVTINKIFEFDARNLFEFTEGRIARRVEDIFNIKLNFV